MHVSRSAIVSAACLVLAGFAAGQARWAEPYREGRDAVKAGRYKEGIPLLERAIQIDSRQAAVKRIEGAFTTEYFPYYYLGLAHLRLGNLDRADAAFRNARACRCLTDELNGLLTKFEGDLAALRSKPDPTPPPPDKGPGPEFIRQANEAESALKGGRPADAIRLFQVLRGMDPEEYARRNLGARLAEAARALAAELVREADDLLRSGQLSAAHAKYEEANTLVPGAGQRGLDEVAGRRAQYQKLTMGAEADLKVNRIDAALEKYKLAEDADPEQYQRDGLAARAQDLTRQAEAGAGAAQKVRDLLRRAQERVAARDYRAAVGLYGQVLTADPANAEAKGWLETNAQYEKMRESGRTLYQQGQLSQALEALENARRQNAQRFTEDKLEELIDAITRKLGDLPEEQIAPVREALVAYLQGDAARARTLLEAIAAGGAPLDARVRAHVTAWLGVAYADLSLTARDEQQRADLRAKAMEQFRQLIAAQPDYQLRDSVISPRVRAMLDEARGGR